MRVQLTQFQLSVNVNDDIMYVCMYICTVRMYTRNSDLTHFTRCRLYIRGQSSILRLKDHARKKSEGNLPLFPCKASNDEMNESLKRKRVILI